VKVVFLILTRSADPLVYYCKDETPIKDVDNLLTFLITILSSHFLENR